jgi:hypothetical protein
LRIYTERESSKKNLMVDRTATRVTVMTVNPYLLHVYWQISGQDLERIQGSLIESQANARPVLRFYDITCIRFDGTNANQIFDVEVDLRTMKWDVPIWKADKAYVIDLGYRASDGHFHQIARSNVVNVPRAEPSPRLAERYISVERGQFKSLLPLRDVSVPPRKPVVAPRLETMQGTRKDTWEPLNGQRERVKAGDPAPAHRSREAGIIPQPVPKMATREEHDLVRLTQERFSFGVSSMPPARAPNS